MAPLRPFRLPAAVRAGCFRWKFMTVPG